MTTTALSTLSAKDPYQHQRANQMYITKNVPTPGTWWWWRKPTHSRLVSMEDSSVMGETNSESTQLQSFRSEWVDIITKLTSSSEVSSLVKVNFLRLRDLCLTLGRAENQNNNNDNYNKNNKQTKYETKDELWTQCNHNTVESHLSYCG